MAKQRPELTCNRCGHVWRCRSQDRLPTCCPKCRSRYWNKARKTPAKTLDNRVISRLKSIRMGAEQTLAFDDAFGGFLADKGVLSDQERMEWETFLKQTDELLAALSSGKIVPTIEMEKILDELEKKKD